MVDNRLASGGKGEVKRVNSEPCTLGLAGEADKEAGIVREGPRK